MTTRQTLTDSEKDDDGPYGVAIDWMIVYDSRCHRSNVLT